MLMPSGLAYLLPHTRISSAVLPKQGAGSTLLSAAAGEEQGQLSLLLKVVGARGEEGISSLSTPLQGRLVEGPGLPRLYPPQGPAQYTVHFLKYYT